MVERVPWDEADVKVKNFIKLSLDNEATGIFYQRNQRKRIDECKTNEVVHELNVTFTRPQKITFYRIQFFNTTQLSNDSLETYYS